MDEKAILKHLTKDDLIAIITSDEKWKEKAFNQVFDIIHQKKAFIRDEQSKCDLLTIDGQIKFFELCKKYEKWDKIEEKTLLALIT